MAERRILCQQGALSVLVEHERVLTMTLADPAHSAVLKLTLLTAAEQLILRSVPDM